jgi:hypothetical protein
MTNGMPVKRADVRQYSQRESASAIISRRSFSETLTMAQPTPSMLVIDALAISVPTKHKLSAALIDLLQLGGSSTLGVPLA